MSDVGQYRKRPVTIEAMQLTETSIDDVGLWIALHGGEAPMVQREARGRGLLIHTLEGILLASTGDWVIKGVRGEFYPCKPDVFAATYEPADATAPDAGDAEALAREIRQRVQESDIYDDDAMPYVVGEDATDEENERQDNLVQWVIDCAAQAAHDAAEEVLANVAARESVLRAERDRMQRELDVAIARSAGLHTHLVDAEDERDVLAAQVATTRETPLELLALRTAERDALAARETQACVAVGRAWEALNELCDAEEVSDLLTELKAVAHDSRSDAVKKLEDIMDAAATVCAVADEGQRLELAIYALGEALESYWGKRVEETTVGTLIADNVTLAAQVAQMREALRERLDAETAYWEHHNNCPRCVLGKGPDEDCDAANARLESSVRQAEAALALPQTAAEERVCAEARYGRAVLREAEAHREWGQTLIGEVEEGETRSHRGATRFPTPTHGRSCETPVASSRRTTPRRAITSSTSTCI